MRCPSCQTENPNEARFCMNCGQPVGAIAPADDARLNRLTAATPVPLAQKVLEAAPRTGERRTVTALFVDVVDSTALANRMDPGDWTLIINGALDRFYPAIYRYEGSIAHLLGDALLAFFGAPVAHEDDPARAVRAALNLIDAAREYGSLVRERYGVEFAVRIGLNTGPVVIGRVGSDLRYEYAPMGGTVSLAARIQALARPMSVLIPDHTHSFVAPLFDTQDAGSIQVKGRAGSARVYEVLGARAGPGKVRGLAGLQSPMVGRAIELAALLQICDAVRAGLGRAALVIGEPGMGKTRLIAEWKAAVEREQPTPAPLWVEGRCLSYGQGLAYHLLIDLLHSLIDAPDMAEEPETRTALMALSGDLFGDEALDVYPYLGHLLSLRLDGEAHERVKPLDPQVLQTQYLAALRKLLLALAARRPLVVVLEDLQWADPSSIELLVRLLPIVSAAPMLLCLVTRAEREAPSGKLVTAVREAMGGSLTEIALDALSEKDSRQLVANLLEINELPEETRTLILKKAEGNPFFIEEIIRMLIDRGAIVRQNGGWIVGAELEGIRIPDKLEGLLTARIDRLPDETRQIVRVAAVIGRQFPLRVLEAVLNRDPRAASVLSQLNSLESAGLIRLAQAEPELEYCFRSQLLQEAVCRSMLKGEREDWHRAVGMALEALYPERLASSELAAMLARHFLEAGDEERALRYLAQGGNAALASFANLEAEHYFRQALALPSSDRSRVEMLSGLGLAYSQQSRFEQAIHVWREAIELCRVQGDTDGLARLYARSTRAAWYGDVAQSLELCQEGLDAVGDAREGPELARLLHEAARAHFFNGMPDKALHLCQQSLSMAERLGAVEVQADALATMGMLHDASPAVALEALTRAVELAETNNLLPQAARAHTNLSYVLHSAMADFRAARAHDRRAAELGRNQGSVAGEIVGLGNVVHLSLLLGDFAEAEETLALLRQLQNKVDNPATVLSHMHIHEASLLRYHGALDETVRILRICQSDARQQNNLEDLSEANVELADALLELAARALENREPPDDVLEEGKRALEEAIEISTQAGWTSVRARCLLAMARAIQGDRDGAAQVLADARECATPPPSLFDELWLAWAEAMMAQTEGKWAEALAAFERAASTAATLGVRWWWAHSLQNWAGVHCARGEPSDLERARALLREAGTIFRELDVPYYVKMTENRLQAVREQSYLASVDQQRAAQELAVAGRMQEGLLPRELPRLPGWEILATLEPARETSGDFYDFIALPEGRLGIVVADVADKGAGAALYMALTRTLIRTFAMEYPTQPGQVMSATNGRILQDSKATMFVTAFYAVLDPLAATLTYCNAGHNPPFYLDGGAKDGARALRRTGMALGVLEQAEYAQETLEMGPGDALVVYSDGITDARDAGGGMFGEERLLGAAQRAQGCSGRRIQEALLDSVHGFVGRAPRFDDITLVVLAMECTPEPVTLPDNKR